MVQGLPDEMLKSLAPGIWTCTFAEGETVPRTGQYRRRRLLILAGFAEVRLAAWRCATSPPRRRERGRRHGQADVRSRDCGPTCGVTAAASRPDGTILLTDFPVEARPDYQARLQTGDLFGEVSALSQLSRTRPTSSP